MRDVRQPMTDARHDLGERKLEIEEIFQNSYTVFHKMRITHPKKIQNITKVSLDYVQIN